MAVESLEGLVIPIKPYGNVENNALDYYNDKLEIRRFRSVTPWTPISLETVEPRIIKLLKTANEYWVRKTLREHWELLQLYQKYLREEWNAFVRDMRKKTKAAYPDSHLIILRGKHFVEYLSEILWDEAPNEIIPCDVDDEWEKRVNKAQSKAEKKFNKRYSINDEEFETYVYSSACGLFITTTIDSDNRKRVEFSLDAEATEAINAYLKAVSDQSLSQRGCGRAK